MSVNYEFIGKQIKKQRMLAKVSQLELAGMADSSPQYISDIERAKKHPSLEILIRISKALNISANVLLLGNTPQEADDVATEISRLLDGCTDYEKTVMLEVADATKRSLKENKWMHSGN